MSSADTPPVQLDPAAIAAVYSHGLFAAALRGAEIGHWISETFRLIVGEIGDWLAKNPLAPAEQASMIVSLRAVNDTLATVIGVLEGEVLDAMPRGSKIDTETGEKITTIPPLADEMLDITVVANQPRASWRKWDVPRLVRDVVAGIAESHQDGSAEAFGEALGKYLSITGAKASIKDLGLRRRDYAQYGPPPDARPKVRIVKGTAAAIAERPDGRDIGDDDDGWG